MWFYLSGLVSLCPLLATFRSHRKPVTIHVVPPQWQSFLAPQHMIHMGGDLGETEGFGCKISPPAGDQITREREKNAPWHGLCRRQGDILRLKKSTFYFQPLHMLWRCVYKYQIWVRLRSTLELCHGCNYGAAGETSVDFGAASTAGSIQPRITSEIKINLIPYWS